MFWRVGTWGEGAFDNDSAADWSHEFDGADHAAGMTLIKTALQRAADGHLGTRDGELAVAAAELVAYLADQPTDETAYNRAAFDWADRVDAAADPELVSLAVRALARVIGEESELADLWDEEPGQWRISMTELTAKLLDTGAEPAAGLSSDGPLPGHFYRSAVMALAAIPATEVPGIYAISFFFWNQDDDPNRPALTIGYNTEDQIQHVLNLPPGHQDGPAGDEAEARWNYAYWRQNELAVIGDATRDPVGAGLIQDWMRASDLWFPALDPTDEADAAAEAIDDYITGLSVSTARQLHGSGVISRTFGRPIPVLVHELEYYDWIADLTEAANPPGLADAFTTWIRTQ
jgi:hypothetical protein